MDAVAILKELVSFNSVSSLSNLDIGRCVQERLAALGFETEWIDYVDGDGVPKVSVVGKKGHGRGGFGYFGHNDVVPADPWFSSVHGPFDPFIENDKLYGRGSCDMKGSVACALAAAAQFKSQELKAPLYFVCTADEEVGYRGASEVAQRSRFYQEMRDHGTHGVIGEPTRLEVVHAHKGTYGFVATSHGRAAHSSTRHGCNANLAMIPFLQEMKAIHDETEKDPAWQNDEFDPPTVCWNIGINDHTRAINITAPQSICTVYFRPMPGQEPLQLLKRAEQAALAAGIEFKVMRSFSGFYVDPQSSYVQTMLALSGKNASQTVCYGTDGCIFSDLPNLVVCGPGDIAQAHTHDEWIELQQLDLGVGAFAKFIQHWCCDVP